MANCGLTWLFPGVLLSVYRFFMTHPTGLGGLIATYGVGSSNVKQMSFQMIFTEKEDKLPFRKHNLIHSLVVVNHYCLVCKVLVVAAPDNNNQQNWSGCYRTGNGVKIYGGNENNCDLYIMIWFWCLFVMLIVSSERTRRPKGSQRPINNKRIVFCKYNI